ncbi:MAG TPA: hypothetical protein VEY09_12040 [Pyrinomonadaceae bacterium]|nr:hypothetical protein [Pyrinomonadaceae bacterium]
MKRILSIALLATTLAATAGAAQAASEEGKARKGKAPAVAAEAGQAAGAAQKKDGTDCSPQRAGVRCNRPKPKKPWFFGK